MRWKNCVLLPATGWRTQFHTYSCNRWEVVFSGPVEFGLPHAEIDCMSAVSSTAVSNEAWSKLRDWASVAIGGPAATLRQRCPCLSRNRCNSQAEQTRKYTQGSSSWASAYFLPLVHKIAEVHFSVYKQSPQVGLEPKQPSNWWWEIFSSFF